MILCSHCDEEILPHEHWEEVEPGAPLYHRECKIRICLGSAEHIRLQCTCYRPVGMAVDEPEGLTLRECARRAAAALAVRTHAAMN